jgi:ABC-type multidrug transport system fused ATPase/permease subunit
VLITRVVVPGVITEIYTDMRVLLGWAWTYLIVAELIGVSSGITYFINQQAKYRAYERVFASIILIGLIGLVTDLVLASLGRQLFPWLRTARRGWFSALVGMLRGRGAPCACACGRRGRRGARRGRARMSAAASGHLEQAPEVRARFDRLKQRPVILEVRDLSKTFTAHGRPPTHALQRVSFQLHKRELTCVIGPSGCGKSTLARLVAGLEEPTGGEMLLDGKPIHGPGSDRGMVFQSYTLFPWLTVLKNVMFGLEASGAASSTEAQGQAKMWLELVGLSKFASAYPHQLSAG